MSLIITLVLLALVAVSLAQQVNGAHSFQHSSSVERSLQFNNLSSCLICNVAAGDVQYYYNTTGPVNDFLACMTENSQEPDGLSNQFYMLDQLPTSFIRRYKKQLYSGNARICIHQGHANRHNHQVVIPNSSAIQLLPANPDRSRRLYPSTGQNSVLVVRVTTTAGEDPGVSNGLLQGTIFGIGSSAQNATLISQYAACSQGKLTLFPFTGNNVVNGVLNVQYQGNISGNPVTGSIQSALNTLVLQGLGVSSLSQAADHLLFCLPDGGTLSGSSNWIAFSYVNSMFSYFQKGWCQRLSAQVHETGHQLGFRHSGLGNAEYGDESCYMGYSFNNTGRPQECFNGYKNWLSGWFEDRKVSVNPIVSGPWVGNLVSFVDYPLSNQIQNGVTIINAGYLYIQLNSAKKYNYQVVAYGNTITVVENNATALWSNALVQLTSGQSYTYANFSGSGIGLVIQVCSLNFGTIDHAKISLYLQDGVQKSQCSAAVNPLPTPFPTPPTKPPTPRPTRLPTPLPTPRPTSKPTPRPTQKPTSRPTPLPTSLPTSKPTSPPVSPKPTSPPVSPKPTPLPVTSRPTTPPTTKRPTPPPATKRPTPPPVSPKPTSAPVTPKPTSPPVTPKPTSPPVTPKPTSPPVTPKPTSPPVTPKPTSPPSPSPTSLPAPSPTLPPVPKPVRTRAPHGTRKPKTHPPTSPPTPIPTNAPTQFPTFQPTTFPPTLLPTFSPTKLATSPPPILLPTPPPSLTPSVAPTRLPTSPPTTISPSHLPTLSPTTAPTASPTSPPSPPTTTFAPSTLKPTTRPRPHSTPKPRRRGGPPSSTAGPSASGSNNRRRDLENTSQFYADPPATAPLLMSVDSNSSVDQQVVDAQR